MKKIDDIIIAKKLVSIENSAKSREIPFNMSFNKMKQLMSRKTCYYTGVPFNNDNPRSLDRVDNELGYIDSNVVACTVKFNSIKGNLTIMEIKNLAKKIDIFIANK